MRRWCSVAVLTAVVVLAAGCTTDPKKATRHVDAAVAAALGIPVDGLSDAGVRSDPGSVPVACLDACPSATVDLPASGGDHPEWAPAAVLDRLLADGYTLNRVNADAGGDAAKCRQALTTAGSCALSKRVTVALGVADGRFTIRADGG
jgi:hypothetical protein